MTATPPSIAAALFGAMNPRMDTHEPAEATGAAVIAQARWARGAARWSALFNRQSGGCERTRAA